MKKIVPLLVVAILMGILALAVYRSQSPVSSPVFSWSFITEDADSIDAPKTTVFLHMDTQKYTVGTYAGTCFDRPREEMGDGEMSGVRCWWAGGGDDVGVFSEQGKMVLKQRVLDE